MNSNFQLCKELLPPPEEISRDVGNSENLSDIPHKDKDRHISKTVHYLHVA